MSDVFLAPQAMPEDHQAPLEESQVPSRAESKAADLPENTTVQGPLTFGARLLLAVVMTVAAAVLANSAVYWHSPDLIKFGAFLSISLISAGARLRVPG